MFRLIPMVSAADRIVRQKVDATRLEYEVATGVALGAPACRIAVAASSDRDEAESAAACSSGVVRANARSTVSARRLVSRWTYVDGVRMHASVGGAGSAVVLVHGFGVSGRYLVPLAEVLTRRCSVLVVDLPGHGRSGRARAEPSIENLADALGKWLDAVRLDRPLLLGSSMGCQVVTALAAREPERVGPLVLIGPTVDPAKRGTLRQVWAAFSDAAREPGSLVALAAGEGMLRDRGELLAAARSAFADRIEDRLPLVLQPTVVIHAERDGFVSRAWAEEVAARLPRGRLVVVPGEPHALPYTQPELVAGIVCGLLADEAEDAPFELARRFPHRHVPAGESDELGTGEQPLPLPGELNGHESVGLAPHE